MNNRKVWTGVLAGVLAAGLLVTVALGAFRAGQRRDVVTPLGGDGQVVRVIDNTHWDSGHWRYGPGPGFFLFPLLGIGLVVLLVSRARHGGFGPGGYGPGGWGPGGWCGSRPSIDDWHRRAHEQQASEPGADAPTQPTG